MPLNIGEQSVEMLPHSHTLFYLCLESSIIIIIIIIITIKTRGSFSGGKLFGV
jgi:hypothetical protein